MFIKSSIGILLLLASAVTTFAQAQNVEQQFIDSAQSYFEKDEFDKAIIELDKAVKFSPRSSKLFLMRGDCKWLSRDMEGAVADYTRAIELGPSAPGIERAYNNRGVARQNLGNDINAFSDFERAISINPKYADPFYSRGVIFEKRGKPDIALKDFDRAILLDPFRTPAYAARGNIRFRKNLLPGALSDYDKAIELFPNVASSYIIRGAIHGMRAKWEMSLADLRTGFDLNSEPGLTGVGVLGVAFNDIDKFVRANPANARAYAVRGFLNLLRNRPKEVDRDFNKSFQLEPKLRKDLKELIESVKGRIEANTVK
jgi:tetratricopeptide (TPR) repeat protein